MAFQTIDGKSTGVYGPDGNPSGINQLTTTYSEGKSSGNPLPWLPSGIVGTTGCTTGTPFNWQHDPTPYDPTIRRAKKRRRSRLPRPLAEQSGFASSNSSHRPLAYAQGISNDSFGSFFRAGKWNRYSGSIVSGTGLPVFDYGSGYWNIGNDIESSPNTRSLEIDQSNLEESVSYVFALGSIPRPREPFNPPRLPNDPPKPDPNCNCVDFPRTGDEYWGPDKLFREASICPHAPGIRDYLFARRQFPVFSGTTDAYGTGYYIMEGNPAPGPFGGGRGAMGRRVEDIHMEFFGKECPKLLEAAIGRKCTIGWVLQFAGTNLSELTSKENCKPKSFHAYQDSSCVGHDPANLFVCDSVLGSKIIRTFKFVNTYAYTSPCMCLSAFGAGPAYIRDWHAANSGNNPYLGNVYATGWMGRTMGGAASPCVSDHKYVIVATGGGGNCSGDNTEPHWDDTNCSWTYAIQEMNFELCGGTQPFPGEDGLEHVLFASGGAPTGAVIEVFEDQLWYGPLAGGRTPLENLEGIPEQGLPRVVDWLCACEGAGETGVDGSACLDRLASGDLFGSAGVVCYNDIPYAIVEPPEFKYLDSGVPTCTFYYTIQPYVNAIPEGTIVTGVPESSMSGYADCFRIT